MDRVSDVRCTQAGRVLGAAPQSPRIGGDWMCRTHITAYTVPVSSHTDRANRHRARWPRHSTANQPPLGAFTLAFDKDKMIISLPHVLRPRTVAAQPEHSLDASQIETFWEVVRFRECCRRYGDRAIECLVSPDGLSPRAFGLITILQSQMQPQLKGAATKTKLTGSRVERGDSGAAWETEIADRQLDGCHSVARRRRREMIAGEESLRRLVE